MRKNWMILLSCPERARRLLVALIAAVLIGGISPVNAWDDDDDWGDDDYDDYGDFGDDYDVDMGDTVIIDDSVNIYDGGGYGGRGRRGGSGGDAAGAAIVGFIGGMVVNEMSQDRRRSAPQPQQAAPAASGQAAPTLEQRLAELDSLRARGILTDAEYNAKRQTIINAY